MLSNLRSDLGTVWCSLVHDSPMWPVHGEYECRICGRHYPAFRETTAVARLKRGAQHAALPLLLVLAAASAARPARAAELAMSSARAQAEAALKRYVAAGSPPAWAAESVDIHASLERLDKTGRLKAIRTLVTDGGAEYQAVELGGDRTVKDQVIVRYLHSQERALRMTPSSVALAPANYRFAYLGVVDDGERLAYAFRITPRKKRDGLIKGELWLDMATGLPIRRSGHLVKSPSVWIKRVTVTQEDSLRDGSVEARLTHIYINTRLVGRAELVVTERPLAGGEGKQAIGEEGEGGQQ
jgi:hypothetical protein